TSAYNMDTTELNSPSALHLDVINRSYSHTPTQRSLTQFDVPGRFIYSPATFSSPPPSSTIRPSTAMQQQTPRLHCTHSGAAAG
ncbi:hypothetical protein K474DRAFT_1665591, partial [Panus rudis PR-1116 ss-1]